MAKIHPLIAAVFVTVAAPLVAGCAPAGTAAPGAEALTPKQAKLLDKQLGGKVPGEPVRCISNAASNETIRVSDDILLYRQSGRLVYRNDLRGSCPGLARDSDIMVVRQFGSQTCAGDFFHLVDRSSGIRGPTCVLGDFVPYRKPAGNEG
ncbi:hypothetical protein EAO27_11775 [Sphingopyxis sp. YF1]|jgi:hypothetical protein|uniref:hypothetical protein n=1 Tax=Sphingopyxis sp. YF1 TaxID=2482763 RepID=UPI001F617B5B|nr:hypothetical protein [Sphingopyxis sp. YF1]UNU43315.1 hypothetical protein EAO27_11775 [Sphingopyxis sp. YF1]